MSGFIESFIYAFLVAFVSTIIVGLLNRASSNAVSEVSKSKIGADEISITTGKSSNLGDPVSVLPDKMLEEMESFVTSSGRTFYRRRSLNK